jgi:hypothetical protein
MVWRMSAWWLMVISDGSAANVEECLLLELYNIHRDRRAQAFPILGFESEQKLAGCRPRRLEVGSTTKLKGVVGKEWNQSVATFKAKAYEGRRVVRDMCQKLQVGSRLMI